MNTRLNVLLTTIAMAFAGCGDDADTGSTDVNGEEDTGTPGDNASCQRLQLGEWEAFSSDVSVSLEAPVKNLIDGEELTFTFLFERYSQGPDIGTFDLSDGADANFGTCAHCVVASAPGGTVYYVETGILTTRKDPYKRRFDMSLTGARLIEVTLDPATRFSTPVDNGRCVVLDAGDLDIEQAFPPSGWTCPEDDYADGEGCHCDCGAADSDCGSDFIGEVGLPVVDCAEGTTCGFDPILFAPRCEETCDWGNRVGCSSGTCVFNTGWIEEPDQCVKEFQRLDEADIGEACESNNFQRYCALTDGFALGYCDAENTCRGICGEGGSCDDPEHTCQWFVNDDGYGYCGFPPPEDG